jgi:cystathionine beta-lyase
MAANFDFDTLISRAGSNDLMHEALAPRWGRTDLLPMWVADMGFAVCPAITEALKSRLEHPIFGYTVMPADFWPIIIQWVETHHQWKLRQEWLTYIPGIVKGIGFVVNVFTKPGDKVIIQAPVYHPFRITPEKNGREIVWNHLIERPDGLYDMDFDELARCYDEHCKLFILCNPHNPGGVVWSRETLVRLAEFCYERGILVISDEIHCDLVHEGHRHVPFASVSAHAADISITFQAPSKTFNIAGIVSSYSIVPNPALRRPFYSWLEANELNDAPIFAPIATMAAYREGERWRQEMLAYVADNARFVADYCRDHIPGVRAVVPEASFLVWLDCRGLGLSHAALLDRVIDKAHLALNAGEMFGPGGEGHMRFNVGCPRALVQQAMDQLAAAVAQL